MMVEEPGIEASDGPQCFAEVRGRSSAISARCADPPPEPEPVPRRFAEVQRSNVVAGLGAPVERAPSSSPGALTNPREHPIRALCDAIVAALSAGDLAAAVASSDGLRAVLAGLLAAAPPGSGPGTRRSSTCGPGHSASRGRRSSGNCPARTGFAVDRPLTSLAANNSATARQMCDNTAVAQSTRDDRGLGDVDSGPLLLGGRDPDRPTTPNRGPTSQPGRPAQI